MHSSKPIPRCTAVRAESGRLLAEESEVKVRWAGYFERLYQAYPQAVELDIRGVTIPIADLPINCGPPSFVETQAAVNRLKWGKAQGICRIHAEFSMLVEMLHSCHFMQCCALTGTQASNFHWLPTDWKRGLVVPLWKGKVDCQDCNNY